MPGASKDQLPPELETLQDELRARQDVGKAHAVFHIRPSEAHAARLSDALLAWRSTVLPPAARPTGIELLGDPEIDAELDRLAEEKQAVYLATAGALAELARQAESGELDHGLWVGDEPRWDDVHIDGHVDLTKIVAAALAALGNR